MNFNKLITQTVTQAGVPKSEMNFLTQTAENISKLTGVNLNDVANSLYRVASGTASWNKGLGATKQQLYEITKQVSQLQVLGNVQGGATSEQAARVITAMVNAHLKDVGTNPETAGALLNAVIGAGDIRMSDLVPAIGRGLLSSTVANHMTAKDALSWVDVLTSLGTTGSVAGNYVKTGVNLLTNPSAQGTAALAMLGIKPQEMAGIMSGPGGLQGAVALLISSMKKFNPGGEALYRDSIGNVRAGGAGMQAAINKLETWEVGEMPASEVAAWRAGKLTPAQQAQVTDLILTKAFGGSKQFATIAALTNNFGRLQGIESTISRNDTLAKYRADVAMAENTPSQRFDKQLRILQVDLVNAGKAMYPTVIKFVDGLTWIIGKFLSWKPALFEVGAALLAVVGFAASVKIAQMGKGLMSIIGGIQSKFGIGEGGVFRNAYDVSSGKMTMNDLGLQLRQLGITEAKVAANVDISGASIKSGIEQLNATSIENTDRLEAVIAENGGGRLGGIGRGAAAEESAASGGIIQLRDPKTGRLLSYAQSQEIASMEANAESAALGYGYTPRGVTARNAAGGFISNAEMSDRASLLAKQGYINMGANSLGEMDASYGSIVARGAAADAAGAAAGIGTGVAEGAAGAAGMLGSAGLMAAIGGPVGIALIAATVLPMAMPYLMRWGTSLTGAIGRWLSGPTLKLATAAAAPGYNTSEADKAKIASAQKKIAQMNSAGYNILTATQSQNSAWYNAHGILATAEAALKKTSPAQQLALEKSAWGIINNPKIASLMALTSSSSPWYKSNSNLSGWDMVPATRDRGINTLLGAVKRYKGLDAKTIKDILLGAEGNMKDAQLSGVKNWQSLPQETVRQISGLVNSVLGSGVDRARQLLKTPTAVTDLYGNRILPGYAEYISSIGKVGSQANWKNVNDALTLKGLNSGNLAERESIAGVIAKASVGMSESDFARSKDVGLGYAADKVFLEASKKAASEAGMFEELKREMSQSVKHTKLDYTSIQSLAKEIDKNMTQLFDAKQLSATQFGAAFSAALAGQSRSLAAMINQANKSRHGTGAKSPQGS